MGVGATPGTMHPVKEFGIDSIGDGEAVKD